ncbi:AMP-binding protein [Streptomyces sp. NPDC092952]|uniref:AMP-binding protein n=1 Tax=Streptomyces sp. NPDC092952 TaxID=3366018 RepID=UPI0038012B63
MSNLASVLTGAAGPHPRRPVLRIDGTVLTLLDLDELSARVAGGLVAHGVRPGDRVELAVAGAPVLPVLYFGALRAGAVAVVAAPRPVTACGTRLVFTTGEGAHGAGTDAVRVGAGFLDQLVFWPQHSEVVRREDDEAAVVVGSWAGRGRRGRRDTYTHGAARSVVAAGGGCPLSAPGLTGPRAVREFPGRGAAGHVPADRVAPLARAAGRGR